MDKVYLAYNRMGRRGLRGAGDPNSVLGTPSRAGLRYLDTTTGLLYLSRNVLNFNNSRIETPTITGVRKINLQFWHNDPAPAVERMFHDGASGDGVSVIMYSRRAPTTGNLSVAGIGGLSLEYDGSSIAGDAVNPTPNTWHRLSTISSTSRKIGVIGNHRAVNSPFLGRLVNVQILGASDALLANYAIDEGSGTTIIDSSGNGQNGTLTLGSGNWQLDWLPL